MIHLREHSLDAMGRASRHDLLAIASDHHLRRPCLRRSLRHPHNHRRAANVCQGFVGQTRGGEASGDEDGEAHVQIIDEKRLQYAAFEFWRD
jgi:hypothetical protein